MARRILIALCVAVAALLLVIASFPWRFRVERSLLIPAPADAVFTQVNDFHAWAGWSPWQALDPAAKKSFSGAPTGVGSVYAWLGNDNAGEGQMTMARSDRPTAISIERTIVKPVATTDRLDFAFVPEGAGTRVTWWMSGETSFPGNVIGLFQDLDGRVGGDFERGLAALSVRSQAQARADAESRAAAEVGAGAAATKSAAEAAAGARNLQRDDTARDRR